MKYNPITRRFFLQGAGGLALTIPSLTSFLPKAEAQAATSNSKRFLVMNNWYGRDYRKWYAHDDKPVTRVTGNGGYAYRTLSDLPGDISQILPSSVWDASLRKKIALVRGLDIMDVHDGHNFTAATSGTLDVGDKDPRFSASIDGVLENSTKFYPVAPRLGALRMSPTSTFWGLENSLYTFSWTTQSGRNSDLISYSWPHTVYQKFFTQAVVDQAAVRAQRLTLTTNAVYDDFSKIMGSQKISAADRARLDNYMQLLSQIEKKLGIAATRSGAVCAAPASTSSLPTSYTAYKSSSYVYGVCQDLMTVALACGMTKIGLLNHMLLGEDFERDNPGNDKFHNCAHNPDGQTYNFPAINMNRFVYDNNAALLKKLDAVQDVDGNTLLDNTVVLIANDDSTGAHELYDMPVILAGGKGVLRTDMMIDYRNTSGTKGDADILLGRPYNNLLVTLFRALGLGAETYKQTPDQKGFGWMTRSSQFLQYVNGERYKNYYGQFMTDTAKDQLLPNLIVGA